MIEGALIALGGMLIGWLAGRRNRRAADAGQPICGCKHHLSMHDPDQGACHGRRSEDGDWRDCACRRYVGPESITSYFAPPLAEGDMK